VNPRKPTDPDSDPPPDDEDDEDLPESGYQIIEPRVLPDDPTASVLLQGLVRSQASQISQANQTLPLQQPPPEPQSSAFLPTEPYSVSTAWRNAETRKRESWQTEASRKPRPQPSGPLQPIAETPQPKAQAKLDIGFWPIALLAAGITVSGAAISLAIISKTPANAASEAVTTSPTSPPAPTQTPVAPSAAAPVTAPATVATVATPTATPALPATAQPMLAAPPATQAPPQPTAKPTAQAKPPVRYAKPKAPPPKRTTQPTKPPDTESKPVEPSKPTMDWRGDL